MSARCHLCGAGEVSPLSTYGSPLCAECLPAGAHVVSMQTAPGGGSLAVCRCGWQSTVRGAKRHMLQDVKVKQHWRGVIARTAAAYDVEFGDGAALEQAERGLAGLVGLIFAVCVLGAIALSGGVT